MKLLISFLAGVTALASQVIEGSVADSITGAPLDGASVSVETGGKPAYQTTTNAQGAFHIEGLKPGYYTANFSKTNYLEMDANAPERRPFSLSSSDPVRLQAKLTPFGKVIGHVLDANGDPVPGAEVLLDGARLSMSKNAGSDGAFTFRIAPGRYRLLATPPRTLKLPPGAAEDRLGWVPTYYPRVTDARAAAMLVVRPGAELWGSDVRLTTAAMRRVHGVILDPQGRAAPGATVRIARLDGTLSRDFKILSAEDGSFDFPFLYDGEWNITAQIEVGGVKLAGSAAALVGDRDLDSIELRLLPPFVVRGTVMYAGKRRSGDAIEIFLRPRTIAGSQHMPQGASVKDKTFQIAGVYPGAYKFIVNPPDTGYYVASIKAAGKEILGEYVDLSSSSPPVEITFDTNGGIVRGKIDGCGSATIALAPQDKRLQDAQFVYSGKCAEDGRFEVLGVRPGDYFAFALSRWDGPLDLLASLDQSLANLSVTVHVNAGQQTDLALRVLNREP
jgi:hypothetical protein